MRRDTLILPFSFIADETFRMLQHHSQDEAAPLLGRLIMLASLVATQRRVKFTVTEIDSLVAWKAPVYFADCLERVGWCSRPDKLSVVLTLPEALQKLSPRTIAGKERAKAAKRDEKGRYIRPEGGESAPRYAKRENVTLDSEGNIVRAGASKGREVVRNV